MIIEWQFKSCCVQSQQKKNAFYIHPKNILLVMLNDPMDNVRNLAIKKYDKKIKCILSNYTPSFLMQKIMWTWLTGITVCCHTISSCIQHITPDMLEKVLPEHKISVFSIAHTNSGKVCKSGLWSCRVSMDKKQGVTVHKPSLMPKNYSPVLIKV